MKTNELIIEKFAKKYWIYPGKILLTSKGLQTEGTNPIVVDFEQRQRINDNLDIYITSNQGVGLSDLSTRFLYFSWKNQGNDRRYRLQSHPRLKNFFVVAELNIEDWEALITPERTKLPTNSPQKEEHAFTIFGKTLEELKFMFFQEREHWSKYKIWKTNPHNVENIKAAIKHLKKTSEEKTTKNYYSFK